EVIRGEAFTCHPDDTIADAERSLMERRVRRLPVVDQDGRLLGIISLADIAQVAAAQRDLKKRDVVDHELADVLCAITTPRSHEESAISR
ncbi:MAG TPA: CBS domain-containing protein, partial [Planctomycetota bacterium]|nr:CBS domain-containing protein [Planctomycetota bacterium]